MLLSLCQWKNSGCELFEGQQLWSPRKTLESPASHRGCDPLHRKIKLNSKVWSLHSVQAVWYNLERKESQARHRQNFVANLLNLLRHSASSACPARIQTTATGSDSPKMPKHTQTMIQMISSRQMLMSSWVRIPVDASSKKLEALDEGNSTGGLYAGSRVLGIGMDTASMAWGKAQMCAGHWWLSYICSCMVFSWYYGIL